MKLEGLGALAISVAIAAASGCAEPFDRPVEPEPTFADEATRTEAETKPRADLGAAVDAGAAEKTEGPGSAPSRSDDDPADGEKLELKEEAHGDVLLIEGDTPKALPDAKVTLRCSGTKEMDEGYVQSQCSSKLSVHTGKGKKASLVAETEDVPDKEDFKADGGEHETTLAVSLLPLSKKPRAALIRVTSSYKAAESISEDSSDTEDLYLLRGGQLVKVLSYVSSSRSKVDTDPPHDVDESQQTTLTIDKTLTRGLPDLILREVASESKNGRARKRKITTRYVWNGEVYDACAPKLDTVQHCGACGHACKKGEGCCDKRCMPLDSAEHCGACDKRCKASGQGDAPLCVEPAKKRCEIACVGDHYDVDGDAKNGCEKSLEPAGHHSPETALDRGDKSCGDTASRDEVRGELLSDHRAHDGIAEWSARAGAAPTYVRVRGRGGLWCQNNLFAALRIEGGAAGKRCYRLTVRTERGQRSVDAASGDEAIIQAGRGAYSSGTAVLFKVHKLCPQPDSVRFTLRYHL